MTVTAKWLVLVCALMCSSAIADDASSVANVIGVPLDVDAEGMPVVSEAQRQQLIDNLRASFAARGIPAKSGPLKVSPSGVESMSLGLDHQSISVARTNESGDLEMLCVHGDVKAAEFLAGASAQ